MCSVYSNLIARPFLKVVSRFRIEPRLAAGESLDTWCLLEWTQTLIGYRMETRNWMSPRTGLTWVRTPPIIYQVSKEVRFVLRAIGLRKVSLLSKFSHRAIFVSLLAKVPWCGFPRNEVTVLQREQCIFEIIIVVIWSMNSRSLGLNALMRLRRLSEPRVLDTLKY